MSFKKYLSAIMLTVIFPPFFIITDICYACSFVNHKTLNNTIWKVVEYGFDYYYGYYNMDFYLRYEDDNWWKWDEGFPAPAGLSRFRDFSMLNISWGFAYGNAEDMHHYQDIIFNHDNNTAVTHCYRLLKEDFYPGEENIAYELHLFKIADDWDGRQEPPQEWDGIFDPLNFDPDYYDDDFWDK